METITPFNPTSFLFEIHEQVARITLNRPERLNALTFKVYQELSEVFAGLQTREDVRVVVISGAGRAFCSGGDVREIIPELLGKDVATLTQYNRMTESLVLNIRKLGKPVLAAVNGIAAGAGAALALACDFRIASETAAFAFLFTQVGLAAADMGVCYFLAKVVGLGRATEWMMLAKKVTAAEAYQAGLVNAVVAPEKFEAEVEEWVGRLKAAPPLALTVTKEILNQALSADLETAVQVEIYGQTLCMQSMDFQEAHRAAQEKRKPVFTGK
ncbi:MAG: enoyl-CoA hydratase/isomerase family protein [Acidobacteria bacterium]|nr:enoyl-CoA hydratase/isomerase family protein [Acidobacteriota bacterium]